jgi:acyl-CoA dehydrogenase
MVRDFSRHALELHGKQSSTPKQAELCLKMIRRAAVDQRRYGNIWTNHVLALNGAYVMNE